MFSRGLPAVGVDARRIHIHHEGNEEIQFYHSNTSQLVSLTLEL